ncbi:hypothetical protein PsYK624_141060 [Phanerochaete sordida]|uniref:Fungal-type protein kinase domain-containing protein n=1 Tax=Phanerochaete sordida TaxID=48140 RepID=A0A9P3LKP3_9APHY|nr:hypothetical protein PsYK624_141060 [Phanerochaete sordida]
MDNKYTRCPYSEFIHAFVPGKDLTRAQLAKLGDLSPLTALNVRTGKERSMYLIFVGGLLDPRRSCTAEHQRQGSKFNMIQAFAKSSDRWNDVSEGRESGCINIRTDIALHLDCPEVRQAYDAAPGNAVAEERKDHAARNAWAWTKIFVKFIHSESESGYRLSASEPDFLNDSDAGEMARAQNTKYASEIMLRQHREFLFSIYATPSHAAVFRWDRTGIIYTVIDLRTDSQQLFNFIYRFALLSAVQQGYDSTVTLATKFDIDKLREYKSTNKDLTKLHRSLLVNAIYYPIYKMQCETLPPDDGDAEEPTRSRRTRAAKTRPTKAYLIGHHATGDCIPTGRCTRTYVGYDMDTDMLVYIKDSWRAKSDLHPETETYVRLKKHDVHHIPTILAGGDVGGATPQCTVSQDYQPPGEHRDVERVHHRVVVKEIGRPIDAYPNSGELIHLMFIVLVAHFEAWTKAGVLHRDISLENMLIDVESPRKSLRSLLPNWDLCRYKEDFEDGSITPSPARSGTWPFLSALCLRYPKKPQVLSDDLESFVYAILCLALRFHNHDMTPAYPPGIDGDALREINKNNHGLMQHVARFFYQDRYCGGGYWSGGNFKMATIKLKEEMPVVLKNGPDGNPTILQRLIDELYALLREHYETLDYAELEKYKVVSMANDPSALSMVETASDEDARSDADSADRASLGTVYSEELDEPQFLRTPQLPVCTWPADKPRPLDDHRRILRIFQSIVRGRYGSILKLCRRDKTPDQMDGLMAVDGQEDHRSSLKRSSRSDADYGIGCAEVPHKRMRVECYSYATPLDPIPGDLDEKPAPVSAQNVAPAAAPHTASTSGASEVMKANEEATHTTRRTRRPGSRVVRAARGRKAAPSAPTRRSTRNRTAATADNI